MTTQLSILNTPIRTFENLYSLNDLHIASGGEDKHRPTFFIRLDTTKDLITEIENENSDVQICTSKNSDTQICVSHKSLRTGINKGTWACEELVLAYATWISPKFHLIVLRAFLAMHKGQPQQLALPEPEKKIDNENQPQYTGALSKNTKRLPHPTDLAVFLCLKDNGGSIAGKYNTLMGIPSNRFLCMPESESRHPQPNVANLSKNTKELAMANIITAHYNGTEVFFQNDAFLNATAIAKHFNKLPNEWLRLDSTQEYIELLCKKLNTEKSRILKTTRGVNGGTWLHRRLAVAFARWLNVDFAIWCDEQIENILIGQNKPQQLALPEPEKVFNLQLTEDELKTLSWLWKAAVRMSGILGMLYPALIKLGSSFAPSVCGCSTEYERTFESARKILVRATQDIEIDKLNRNGWNNVLPELRRGEVNSLN